MTLLYYFVALLALALTSAFSTASRTNWRYRRSTLVPTALPTNEDSSFTNGEHSGTGAISQSTEYQAVNGGVDLDLLTDESKLPLPNEPLYDDLSFMTRLDSESTWIEFSDDGTVVPAGSLGQMKEDMANVLAEPIVEVTVSAMVIINCLLVAVSTVDSMPFQGLIRVAENAIGIFFALEFAGRWYSSSQEAGRHVLNPQFAVDIVVVILPLVFGLTPPSFWKDTFLPAWITSPSALINLELLRVLRLRRVLRNMEAFDRFQHALGIPNNDVVKEWQLQLARVLLSLFTLLSVASGMIYTAEHDVNPLFSDYFTALYFGLTTLTTVGMGDIVPITWGGKLVVMGSIVAGVAIVPTQAAALVEALLARQDTKRDRFTRPRPAAIDGNDGANKLILDTETRCDKCGASLHWASAAYCYSCGTEL